MTDTERDIVERGIWCQRDITGKLTPMLGEPPEITALRARVAELEIYYTVLDSTNQEERRANGRLREALEFYANNRHYHAAQTVTDINGPMFTDCGERARAALSGSPEPAEGHPDNAAVDRFAAEMKQKLAQKRREGRGGWEDKENCPHLFLSDMLRKHVEKGDPVDVGNFAMMLHQRGERISAQYGDPNEGEPAPVEPTPEERAASDAEMAAAAKKMALDAARETAPVQQKDALPALLSLIDIVEEVHGLYCDALIEAQRVRDGAPPPTTLEGE